MHQATGARAMQVAETHRTIRWGWFQTVRTSAAGLHRRARASLTPPTGAVSGEWSRSPQNRWNEEEKSSQKHDMCEAGEQDERNQQEAGEQNGIAEDTCDCDSESHSVPWSTATTNESRAGREREVEAQWQSGEGQHCTTGGGPQSVWKHGVREEVVLGEKEVERQLHVPCGEPQFEGPQVAK